MLWVPAMNSSARGEAPGSLLRSCQASLLPQLRTWQGETHREKKNFGERDCIALGLCEENNHAAPQCLLPYFTLISLLMSLNLPLMAFTMNCPVMIQTPFSLVL
uniref:Uncharacterized protein n=1 Tax=Geospiza parvula TaxID=87175 RepID=A0A8U8CDP7_GEOPR